MSCFIVPKEHIDVMCWAAYAFGKGSNHAERDIHEITLYEHDPNGRGGYAWDGFVHREVERIRLRGLGGEDREGLTRLGQILVDENYASVNYRYKEASAPYAYRYERPKSAQWSAEEVISAIRGYEYQSCEAPGWETSPARDACEAIKGLLVDKIVDRAEERARGSFAWVIHADTAPARNDTGAVYWPAPLTKEFFGGREDIHALSQKEMEIADLLSLDHDHDTLLNLALKGEVSVEELEGYEVSVRSLSAALSRFKEAHMGEIRTAENERVLAELEQAKAAELENVRGDVTRRLKYLNIPQGDAEIIAATARHLLDNSSWVVCDPYEKDDGTNDHRPSTAIVECLIKEVATANGADPALFYLDDSYWRPQEAVARLFGEHGIIVTNINAELARELRTAIDSAVFSGRETKGAALRRLTRAGFDVKEGSKRTKAAIDFTELDVPPLDHGGMSPDAIPRDEPALGDEDPDL